MVLQVTMVHQCNFLWVKLVIERRLTLSLYPDGVAGGRVTGCSGSTLVMTSATTSISPGAVVLRSVSPCSASPVAPVTPAGWTAAGCGVVAPSGCDGELCWVFGLEVGGGGAGLRIWRLGGLAGATQCQHDLYMQRSLNTCQDIAL